MWPDSDRRETHDGDRMLALVRGLPAVEVKTLFVDASSDVELIRLVTTLPSPSFRNLENRLRELRPKCDACGYKHWPGDPHETPRGTPSRTIPPPKKEEEGP
jgi:hypothetical protein